MRREQYHASNRQSPTFTPEMLDFLGRRTRPFLDAAGLDTRTVLHLMQEAYLQGIRDAVEVLRPPSQPEGTDR